MGEEGRVVVMEGPEQTNQVPAPNRDLVRGGGGGERGRVGGLG